MLYRLAYRLPNNGEDHGKPIALEVADGWIRHFKESPHFGMEHWIEESEDGMEWTRRATMPTLNEAAEVIRLRGVMTKARRVIAETFPPYSFPTPLEHEEEARAVHGVLVQIDAALAADPGPLVAAVEQMATVLGERHADTCQSLLLDCDCKLGHRQRNALAAYRAALKGEA